MNKKIKILTGLGVVAALLGACGPNGQFDPDLRRWSPAGALSTADAAARAAPRPQPDSRGVISFGNAQVAVARDGDTPATIAARLGLNAADLARHNALPASAALEAGAMLVLPQQVPPGAARQVSSTGMVSDPFAGQQASAPPAAAKPAAAAPKPAAAMTPGQHVVVQGETAWSIARKHGVRVEDLAAWNGLPANMSVRTGQRLIMPVAGQPSPRATSAANTTAPGSGSPTPRPPSASQPLPAEKTTAAAAPPPAASAPDLGASRTSASGSGRFRMPVSGAIIRVYEKGRNDGIDIAATAGTQVIAAGAGSVAAITRDGAGAPIVVIRHDGGLMTVYTGLDGLNVAKNDQVRAGQAIGTAGTAGFVHFEVRQGFDSVDPEKYLG